MTETFLDFPERSRLTFMCFDKLDKEIGIRQGHNRTTTDTPLFSGTTSFSETRFLYGTKNLLDFFAKKIFWSKSLTSNLLETVLY